MKHTLLSIFCLCLFLASCANDNVSPITKKVGSVIINIDNVIGNQNLKYDTLYSIASGEKYTIKKLKYYISNIQFMKIDGSVTTLQEDGSYFLVDESNSASMILSLPQVEIGKYLAIRLMIGVDSAKSMAPLEKRRGVLDMSGLGQDMYWTWNQGYIFFKMEGIYTDFSGKNDDYTYHIGGFGNNGSSLNNIKVITIPLGSTECEVSEDKKLTINLKADISKVFNGKKEITIVDHPIITFSPFSIDIADNYSEMLSFSSLQYTIK